MALYAVPAQDGTTAWAGPDGETHGLDLDMPPDPWRTMQGLARSAEQGNALAAAVLLSLQRRIQAMGTHHEHAPGGRPPCKS